MTDDGGDKRVVEERNGSDRCQKSRRLKWQVHVRGLVNKYAEKCYNFIIIYDYYDWNYFRSKKFNTIAVKLRSFMSFDHIHSE